MRATMQDEPLSIGRILEHGATVHGAATVATWTGDDARRETYAEVGARAAQLAHALSDLGVSGDERVATFMFNSAEHLEAYLAVPARGAVLHTLNLRLPAHQLAWIIDHAEDRVIIADGGGARAARSPARRSSLGPPRHRGRRRRPAVVAAVDALPDVTVHAYEELLAGRPTTYAWPRIDERDAAAVCYTSGTTGDPKGVVYSHRSIWLHSMQVCMKESFCHRRQRPGARRRAAVPRHGLGAALRRLHDRRQPADAAPVPPGRATRPDDRDRAADDGRRSAHHLARPAAPPGRPRRRRLLAARGHRRRLGLSAGAHAGLRRALRRPDRARLGHDGDLAAGHRVPPAPRRRGRRSLALSHLAGPPARFGGRAPGRPGRLGGCQRRYVRRRARGARALGHRQLSPGRG